MQHSEVYIITGQPTVLKNSKRLVKIKSKGKERMIPIASAKVKKAEKAALIELKSQSAGMMAMNPWSVPVAIRMTFYGAWKRGSKSMPDLSNLFEAPQDWLQKANILEDDRLIESVDGSRRVCMCSDCELRQKYVAGAKKGQYKPDCGAVKKCPFERTEIVITEY